MADDYVAKQWVSKEIIRTTALQHIEDGINLAFENIAEIQGLMEENNYINITHTYNDVTVNANGYIELSDINTRSCSAISIQITRSSATATIQTYVYGSINDLEYSTEPIFDYLGIVDETSLMLFPQCPQDKIKLKVINNSASAITIDVAVRCLGNIAFMTKAIYDADDDGVIDHSEHSTKADGLTNGTDVVSYDDIADEIDSNILAHKNSATAHHSNVNDPTTDQKAALAGTNGSPSDSNRFVTNSDSRLSDSRTPVAHTHTRAQITDLDGVYEPLIATKKTAFNVDFGTVAGTACQGNDSRLSNARTPVAHTHVKADITDFGSYEPLIATKKTAFNVDFGTAAGTACQGNDSRLSNARTPTTHAATHESGGSDTIAIENLVRTDVTTGNVSLSMHGLCPKLDGNTDHYLRGDGTWAVPPGGEGGGVVYGTTADTACEGNDVRLSNARTPTAHAATHKTGGSDAIKLDELAAPTDITTLNVSISAHGLCPKLPNDGTKFLSGLGTWITVPLTYGTTAGTICQGNDSRLSDARTPTAHAATHKTGGSDAIKLDELAAPTDVTTLNVSTTTHGLCPKLPNDSTKALKGDGTWGAVLSGTYNTIATNCLTGNGFWQPFLSQTFNASTTQFLRGDGTWVIPAGTWASNFGTAAGTICQGNDSRLSDSRTPTAHASSHKSGGADAIKLDELAAPTDVTTLNVSTSAHGLCPKLPGGTTTFLRADGSWASPSGVVTTFVRWVEGQMSTSITIMPYLVTGSKTISAIKGYMLTKPTGSNVTIDIRKNNSGASTSSIFTSDAAQAISTAATATNGVYQFDWTSALDSAMVGCSANDVLFIVITAVGSTTPGAGFYIEISF